jgi:hypothetical protein
LSGNNQASATDEKSKVKSSEEVPAAAENKPKQ